MKGILKLFPVAFAVAMLASCSADDILGEKGAQNQTDAGDLTVTFDPLDNVNTTRAHLGATWGADDPKADYSKGGIYFAEGDQIKVFDDELYKFDIYEYADAFYVKGNKKLDAPKYALFPGKDVVRGYMDWESEKTLAEFAIPHIITYDENSEKFVDPNNPEKIGYAFDLPMFGMASNIEEEGKVKVTGLRHLAAILRIDLKNTYGNANWLKISNAAGKVLSGTVVAKLETDETDDDVRKGVHLDASLNQPDLKTYPEIYIDLRKVPSPESVIFVPILEGLNGDTDGMKVEYSTSTEANPDNIKAWVTFPGMQFPGITFEHNKIYAGMNAFEFENMSPNKVSGLLAQYAASVNDIQIDLTKTFTLSTKQDDINGGNTIKMPKFENNVNVIINLKESFDTWNNGNATSLTIVDADAANPFTGTITLNVAENLPSANQDIVVNVPEGNVVLTGDFDAVNNKKLTLTAANSVTLGGAETTITESKLTLQKLGADLKALIIAEDATVVASTNGVTAGANTAYIEVAGELTGNITGAVNANVQKSEEWSIVVGEKGTVDGSIDAKDITENVKVAGTVANGITVGKATKLVEIATTGKVEAYGITSTSEVDNNININGSVAGDVVFNGTPKSTGLKFVANATNVTVSLNGRVDGDIDLTKNVLGKVTINAIPTKVTDKIVTGDVTTGGNVEVNLTANTDEAATYKSGEAVAIDGTLKMLGALKEVKLVQGYINTLEAAIINAGTWEQKKITLTLNDENEGIAAIGTLVESDDDEGGVFEYTESLWDGQTPATTSNTYRATNITRATKNSMFPESVSTTGSKRYILTATQLAYYQRDDAYYILGNMDLVNDLNMNEKAKWTGAKIPYTSGNFVFNGNEKTIKNLTLKPANAKSAGLFSELGMTSYTTTVKNLNLKDVNAAITSANSAGIGALAGKNVGEVAVENVKVELGEFGGTKPVAVSNVGGLVGIATANLTVTDVIVSGTISGYTSLGGLVGQNNGARTEIVSATVRLQPFAQDYASGKLMDMNYAAIGTVAGSVTGGNVFIRQYVENITGAYDLSANNWTSKTYASDDSGTIGDFYSFTRAQNWVGYSGSYLETSTTNAHVWRGSKIGDFSTSANEGYYAGTVPSEESVNKLYYFPKSTKKQQ